MPKLESLKAAYEECEEIFVERNKKYGTNGMTISKAVSLASTKLDRLQNAIHPAQFAKNEEIKEHARDLANYGIIMWLIASGLWDEPLEREGQEWTSAMDRAYEKSIEGNPALVSSDECMSKCLLAKRLETEDENIQEPKKVGDCGFDITVAEQTIIPPKAVGYAVPSNVAVKVPDTHFMLIINRSSAIKRNLVIVPGLIDSGYTGPIFSICNNQTDAPVVLEKGDRVAQGVLLPRFTPPLVWVDELPSTERGSSGFGSTGL